MTDAAPPFALPLRVVDHGASFSVLTATDMLILYTAYRERAECLVRAVNSYARMREALKPFAEAADRCAEYMADDEPISVPRGLLRSARTILKEIDGSGSV